jgi:hypothetical protein
VSGRDSHGERDFAVAAHSGRRTLVGELWYYVKLYRSWWVVPILLAFAVLGGLIALSASGAAPFIYALF